MKRILAQCNKEFLQFWRYKITVALAFLLPIITLFIYGFAIRLESKNISLIIQDFDKTPLSRSYIDAFKASNQFILKYPKNINGKYTEESNSYVTKAIDSSVAKVGMIIPPDFTKNIKRNKSCNVQFLVDGTDVVNAKIVKNSIPAITNSFLAKNKIQIQNLQIKSSIRVWFNPGRKEAFFIVPGVFAVVLSLFPAIISAIAMAREKEEETIIQVYASGIKAYEYILGKTLAYLIIAIGEAIITINLGALIFGLHLVGSSLVFVVGTIIFLATTVMFGIMSGAVADSQRTAIQITGITMALSVILLSGFIYPISNIPFPISFLSYIVPSRYYMEIIRSSFVRGADILGTWHLILAIIVIFLVEFLIAWRKIRKMQFND